MEKLNAITINHLRIFNVVSSATQDLTNLFQSVNIYESLYENYTRADVTLVDGVSLLERFPLRGDERVYIEFSGMEKDEMDLYGKEFDVVNINLIDNSRGKRLKVYTLELESLISERNRRSQLRIGIEDTESSIVKNIVKTNLNIDNIEVEASKKTTKYTIPNWKPLQAINYISKYAQKIGGLESASFMFYEDKDGYKYKSLESLIKEESPYPPFTETLAKEYNDLDFYGLKTFQCDVLFNTEENSNNGAYGSTNHEIDLLNKVVVDAPVVFEDNYAAWPKIESTASQIKLNDVDSAKRRCFISYKTDELEDRPVASSTRSFALGLFSNFIYTATTELNSNITVGKIAELQIDSQSIIEQDIEDAILSGKYLITSVRHEFNAQEGATVIELRKPTLFEKA